MPRVLLLSLGLVGIVWFETQICTWTKSLLQAKLKWAMTKHLGVMIWFDGNIGISITVWWCLFSGMYYTWYKIMKGNPAYIYKHPHSFTCWNFEVSPLKHLWFTKHRGCEFPLAAKQITTQGFAHVWRWYCTARTCKQEELFLFRLWVYSNILDVYNTV